MFLHSGVSRNYAVPKYNKFLYEVFNISVQTVPIRKFQSALPRNGRVALNPVAFTASLNYYLG